MVLSALETEKSRPPFALRDSRHMEKRFKSRLTWLDPWLALRTTPNSEIPASLFYEGCKLMISLLGFGTAKEGL